MTAISAVLFLCTIACFVARGVTNPWKSALHVTSRFHIGVLARNGLDSRLCVYDDPYGPYNGGTISLSPARSGPDPLAPKVFSIGDSWGVYYRHITWHDGAVLWTLQLSLWYPLIVFGILPLIWFVNRPRHPKCRASANF